MPSQEDAIQEMIFEQEQCAIRNMNNNDPDYVMTRFVELHGNGSPVPVKPGALPVQPGRYFAVRKCRGRAGPQGGVIVPLEEELTGEVSNFLIETNGLNGVWVTCRVDPTGAT